MNKLTLQVCASLLGVSCLGTVVGVEASQNSQKNFLSFRASNDFNITLNSSNSPTLSNGSGTIIDEKGVTWEYSNASDYANGHVTLNSNSFVGVSSSSAYGITAIESINADFSGDELWLLKSIDGITWTEDKILTSNDPVVSSNGWRYIRFYNYASQIDINSISITYTCSGVSSSEDVDGAHAQNVISTSQNLSYASETSDVSPLGNSTEAVKFTKMNNSNSALTIGFGKTYTIRDIQNSAIEFDMKTANINYGKSIGMMNGATSVGSTIFSDKSTSYKCTNIQDDWYHIEVPVTALISTISGVNVNGKDKDKPHTNVLTMEVNGIKLNAGSCVIDNVRISSTPCELGIYNSPTYKPTVGEFYWLKVAWVGYLYPELVTITFNDPNMGRHLPITESNLLNGSPFYIEWLAAGTVTITCTVISGYNRVSHTVQFTVTVN